jgi:hypothetical protein
MSGDATRIGLGQDGGPAARSACAEGQRADGASAASALGSYGNECPRLVRNTARSVWILGSGVEIVMRHVPRCGTPRH